MNHLALTREGRSICPSGALCLTLSCEASIMSSGPSLAIDWSTAFMCLIWGPREKEKRNLAMMHIYISSLASPVKSL